MDRGVWKGHLALWLANIIWGVNAPVCKGVLASAANPEGINPFALISIFLVFWFARLILTWIRYFCITSILLIFHII